MRSARKEEKGSFVYLVEALERKKYWEQGIAWGGTAKMTRARTSGFLGVALSSTLDRGSSPQTAKTADFL